MRSQLKNVLNPAYQLWRSSHATETTTFLRCASTSSTLYASTDASQLTALQHTMHEQLTLHNPDAALQLLQNLDKSILAQAIATNPVHAAQLFDTALKACALQAQPHKAIQLVNQMWSQKIPVGRDAQLSVLQAYCAAGQLTKAFTHLKRIPRHRQSQPMFHTLIAASIKTGDLDLATKIVAYLEKGELHPDVLLWSQIMWLFSKQRDVESIQRWWQRLLSSSSSSTSPSVWGNGEGKERDDEQLAQCAAARIEALAASKDITAAVQACEELMAASTDVLPLDFDILKTWQLSTTATASPSDHQDEELKVQPTSAATKIPAKVKSIFNACNSLARAAEASGDLKAMRKLLTMMTRYGVPPTTTTYNVLLQAALHSGEGAVAMKEGVEEMKLLGLLPDVYTYTILLRAYGNAGDLQGMSDVYDEILASSTVPTKSTFTAAFEGVKTAALHHGHITTNTISTIPQPIQESTESDTSTNTTTNHTDTTTTTTAVEYPDKAIVRSVAVALLHRWETDLKALDIKVDPALLTASIAAHGAVGEVRTALRLLEDHFGRLVLPNTTNNSRGSSMVRIASSSNKLADSTTPAALLQQQLTSFNNDHTSSSSSSASATQQHQQTLLKRSKKWKLTPDLRTFNAALAACCKWGKLDLAAAVLSKIQYCGLRPDIHSYTSLVSGCAAAQQPELARWIVQFMDDNSTSSGDGDGGNNNVVDVKPTVWTMNALIKVEAFCGDGPAAAVDLVEDMVDNRGLTPDVVTWQTILKAARQNGDDVVVEKAIAELKVLWGDGDGVKKGWRGFYASDEEEDEWW